MMVEKMEEEEVKKKDYWKEVADGGKDGIGKGKEEEEEEGKSIWS